MTSTIALSFSRLSDYEQCPRKFEEKYVTKIYPPEDDNPAFVKGQAIHKMMDKYVQFLQSTDRANKPNMNPIVESALPMVDRIFEACNGNLYPEKQLAVNQTWDLCDWFDKPHVVKYRCIIDCLGFLNPEEMIALDWKTGKVREYEEGPTTQLKLTSVILFSLYPNVKKITTAYVFLEHKKTVSKVFLREDLEKMRAEFDNAHTIVNQAADFPFKKNKYCNWCLSKTCPVKV